MINISKVKRAVSFLALLSLCPCHLQANDLNWNKGVANIINPYFSKQYTIQPSSVSIVNPKNNKSYTVYRPNHSLAHGMRQEFFAVDILNGLNSISNKQNHFQLKSANDIVNWANNKMKNDQYFLEKVAFLSSFQRSGRQSEIGSQQNQNLYNSYLRADAKNFKKNSKTAKNSGGGNLFNNIGEINFYKTVLLPSSDVTNKTTDYTFLSKILSAAHCLDLRRIYSVEDGICQKLFGQNTSRCPKNEKDFGQKLWTRAGEYLAATGDRDIVLGRKNYSPKFSYQAYNPSKLVEALNKARNQSNIIF